MMTNLFDYEMLARQKRETMQTEAAQRRMTEQLAPGLRGGLLARLKTLRVRFGATERRAVATRAA